MPKEAGDREEHPKRRGHSTFDLCTRGQGPFRIFTSDTLPVSVPEDDEWTLPSSSSSSPSSLAPEKEVPRVA